MKSLKLFALLFVILGCLGGYAWFAIVQPESEKTTNKLSLFPSDFLDRIQSLELTTDSFKVKIEKRQDVWWVTSPQEYLGNQEYIEKTLKIMQETESHHHFPLDEDRFEFEPGKAFFRLQFNNGLEKRVRVGSKEGPAETIYLLDFDSREVFVVHNVWAQFLYYPLHQFYHPALPIPGAMVRQMSLFKNEDKQWSVEPVNETHVAFTLNGKRVEIPKANGLWFFKKVREFPLENIEFGEPAGFNPFWRLNIQTNEGNISFEFDETMEKINVPRFKVFAQSKPYSLKSLGYEIEEVFKSDQK